MIITKGSDRVTRVDRYQHLLRSQPLYYDKRRNGLRVHSLISDNLLPDEEPEVPSDTGIWRSPCEDIYATSAKANTQHSQTSAKRPCWFKSSKNIEEEDEIPGDDEKDVTFEKRLVLSFAQ